MRSLAAAREVLEAQTDVSIADDNEDGVAPVPTREADDGAPAVRLAGHPLLGAPLRERSPELGQHRPANRENENNPHCGDWTI